MRLRYVVIEIRRRSPARGAVARDVVSAYPPRRESLVLESVNGANTPPRSWVGVRMTGALEPMACVLPLPVPSDPSCPSHRVKLRP